MVSTPSYNNSTNKKANIVENIKKKFEKCKVDISLLNKCWDWIVYPTFTKKKKKKFKNIERKQNSWYYKPLLLDEIANEHKALKQLNKELKNDLNFLDNILLPGWRINVLVIA